MILKKFILGRKGFVVIIFKNTSKIRVKRLFRLRLDRRILIIFNRMMYIMILESSF